MKSTFLIIFSILFLGIDNVTFAQNKTQESLIRQAFYIYVDLIQEPVKSLNDIIKNFSLNCDLHLIPKSCEDERKNSFNLARNELLKLSQITFEKYFEIKKIDASNSEEQDYKNQVLKEILFANKLWTLDYYADGSYQSETLKIFKGVRNTSLAIAMLPVMLAFEKRHNKTTSFNPVYLPFLPVSVAGGLAYSTILFFYAPYGMYVDIEQAISDQKYYPSIKVVPSEEVIRFRISTVEGA